MKKYLITLGLTTLLTVNLSASIIMSAKEASSGTSKTISTVLKNLLEKDSGKKTWKGIQGTVSYQISNTTKYSADRYVMLNAGMMKSYVKNLSDLEKQALEIKLKKLLTSKKYKIVPGKFAAIPFNFAITW